MGFHHVDQDDLDLLTSWSTRLGLPKCGDYRLEPPRPAFIVLIGLHIFVVSYHPKNGFTATLSTSFFHLYCGEQETGSGKNTAAQKSSSRLFHICQAVRGFWLAFKCLFHLFKWTRLLSQLGRDFYEIFACLWRMFSSKNGRKKRLKGQVYISNFLLL